MGRSRAPWNAFWTCPCPSSRVWKKREFGCLCIKEHTHTHTHTLSLSLPYHLFIFKIAVVVVVVVVVIVFVVVVFAAAAVVVVVVVDDDVDYRKWMLHWLTFLYLLGCRDHRGLTVPRPNKRILTSAKVQRQGAGMKRGGRKKPSWWEWEKCVCDWLWEGPKDFIVSHPLPNRIRLYLCSRSYQGSRARATTRFGPIFCLYKEISPVIYKYICLTVAIYIYVHICLVACLYECMYVYMHLWIY